MFRPQSGSEHELTYPLTFLSHLFLSCMFLWRRFAGRRRCRQIFLILSKLDRDTGRKNATTARLTTCSIRHVSARVIRTFCLNRCLSTQLTLHQTQRAFLLDAVIRQIGKADLLTHWRSLAFSTSNRRDSQRLPAPSCRQSTCDVPEALRAQSQFVVQKC